MRAACSGVSVKAAERTRKGLALRDATRACDHQVSLAAEEKTQP
jgi:hypothetical protein